MLDFDQSIDHRTYAHTYTITFTDEDIREMVPNLSARRCDSIASGIYDYFYDSFDDWLRDMYGLELEED